MATKRTVEDVIRAIEKSRGNISHIATHLNVDRMTVYNYLDRWKTAKKALEEERDRLNDDVENVLIDKILQDKDLGALIWYEKTRRGMSDKMKVEQESNVTQVITYEVPGNGRSSKD